jgi:hypothetical protein
MDPIKPTETIVDINGRDIASIMRDMISVKEAEQKITKVTIRVSSKRNCTVEEFLKIIKMVIDIPITELTIDILVNGLGSYALDRKIMEVVKTSTSIVDFNITYLTFDPIEDPLGSVVSYVPEDSSHYTTVFDPEVLATIKEMLERNRSLV